MLALSILNSVHTASVLVLAVVSGTFTTDLRVGMHPEQGQIAPYVSYLPLAE